MGQQWKDQFFTNFSDEDLAEVKILTSKAKYKFGGDKPVPAIEKVEFPCYILGKRTTIVAYVVGRHFPFLISKTEIKRRGFTIDFNTDTLNITGNKYELKTTYNGNFKLSL